MLVYEYLQHLNLEVIQIQAVLLLLLRGKKKAK